MITKKILLIFLVVFSYLGSINAQKNKKANQNIETFLSKKVKGEPNLVLQTEGSDVEECYTDIIHQNLMKTDAEYRKRFEAAEQRFVQYAKSNKPQNRAVVTVPVVVHVIHTGQEIGEGANISIEQVHSAIDNLNDAYRNIGYTGVDMEIEFCLASVDPNGNPTNGILRVDGTGTGDYENVGLVKSGASDNEVVIKALSKWDHTLYYNIWIVTEIDDNGGGSGIQGFAYFTGGADVDGAVILYNSFGYDPMGNECYNLKSYTNYNVTTIHELGHAFGLYHTFQGDSEGTSCPATGASNGDLVADTPAHIRTSSLSVSGCDDNTANSCQSGTTVQDHIHNFMDYSPDDCQTEFTADQKTRALNWINANRANLIANASTACPGNLVPISDFSVCETTICQNNGVDFFDSSNNNPTTWSWTFTGGSPSTSTDQNPTVIYSNLGTYEVQLVATNATGSGNTEIKTAFITVNEAPTTACEPTVQNSANYGYSISNVKLETIDHTTNSAENGYHDYACEIGTDLLLSGTYGISITVGAPNSTADQDGESKVFIDYNNDGVFADPGELIFSNTLPEGSPQTEVSGSFTVPSNAVLNTKLRMRVIHDQTNPPSPCADLFTGEAEDYFLNIAPNPCSQLFISEYGEPSSGNGKYLEIYNSTGASIDLSNYEIWKVTNGGTWPEGVLGLSGTLASYDVFTIANNSTNVPGADLYNSSICSFNGDDAMGLAYNGGSGTTFSLIDVIGEDGADPGSGWDVAGVTNATKNHTLVRKNAVQGPNTDWTTSAGTNTCDSEWFVKTYGLSDFGMHTSNCNPITCSLSITENTQSNCNDNSTSNNAADDWFSISFNATSVGGGLCHKYEVVLNANADGTGGTVLGSESYGTAISIGDATTPPFQADGTTTYTITIRDIDDNTCFATYITTAVASCSASTCNLSTSLTNPIAELTCTNTSTSVEVTTANGSGSGFTYAWESNGATTNPVNYTSAGNYMVTITDSGDGCTEEFSFTVTEDVMSPTVTISGGTELTCTTTSLILTANPTVQGTATYSWSDASNTTTEALTVSSSGTYTVTVTDSDNGCTNTASVTITEDVTAPSVTITGDLTLDCVSGETTLTANPTVQGTATYSWSDASNTTTEALTVSSSGTYTVTVTDSDNGCANTASVTVSDYPALSITSEASTNVTTCGGSDGTIDIVGTGGNGNIEYSVDDGTTWQTSGSFTGLSVGSYQVVIRDDSDNTCTLDGSNLIIEDANGCGFVIYNDGTSISAPCLCKNDQSSNGAGDGNLEETVAIEGTANGIIRVPSDALNTGTTFPITFTESSAGVYEATFDHVDRVGYSFGLIEFSDDGGTTWTTLLNNAGRNLSISNVCAYPVIGFNPAIDPEYCSNNASSVLIQVSEISTDITFTAAAGFPTTTLDGSAATSFTPNSLTIGSHTINGTYENEGGDGYGGTMVSPAIPTNQCKTDIETNFEIKDLDCGVFPWDGN